MSRDTLNREGLTFEEWVCAAGVAVPDHRMQPMESWRAWPWVMPYSESNKVSRPDWDGPRQRVRGFDEPYFKTTKQSTVFYSKKIRQAWKDGIDPTEWRTTT